jgi:hypothetical protein
MYDPQLGRWHGKEPYAELVPSISLYAYCYNNPVNYIEPGGKWPGWIHKRIIRRALNPYIGHGLTEQQLKIIIEAGEYIDANFQEAKYSKMHSMGIPGQSLEEARNARDEWVNENITEFKKGGKDKYTNLGYAIHAMSDEYSPTHIWKPWAGIKPTDYVSTGSIIIPYGLIINLQHLSGELNLSGPKSFEFKKSMDLVVETFTSADPNPAPNPSPDPIPAPIDPIPSPPIPNPLPSDLPSPPPSPPPFIPFPPIQTRPPWLM